MPKRYDILEQAKTIRADMDSAGTVLTDAQALESMNLYQLWTIGVEYAIGDRRRYKERLYKCVQAHTSQSDWTPDLVPSLWYVIDVEHVGTLDDPIPAVAGMEYTKGKYYIENDVIYLMNREGMADGESIVLYFTPSQLVGQYFEVVE